MKTTTKHKFLAVDFLRGIAAFSVLIWHYQAFYYLQAGGPPNFISRSEQPFYEVFALLYNYGGLAVQLFWAISGFVFAARYLEGRVTARQFIVARFARLYPLHFMTLIVVAILQVISLQMVGHFQVYPYNDYYHLFLNFLFASSWGFEKGFSYNAPIWSVSVELIIYALFFLTIPFIIRMRIIFPSCIIILAFSTQHFCSFCGLGQFPKCAFYFYLGVVLFQVSTLAKQRNLIIGIVVLVIWFGIGYGNFDLFTPWAVPMFFSSILLIVIGLDHFEWSRQLLKKTTWLGESTYSTYLIHIPIIIATNIILHASGFDIKKIVGHPCFLIAFLIIVFCLARISYKYFECPAQNYIRQKFWNKGIIQFPLIKNLYFIQTKKSSR